MGRARGDTEARNVRKWPNPDGRVAVHHQQLIGISGPAVAEARWSSLDELYLLLFPACLFGA